MTSVDTFEDEEDDYCIALDEPLTTAQAQSLLRPAPGATGLHEHSALRWPASAHQTHLAGLQAAAQNGFKLKEKVACWVVREVFSLVVETLTELAEVRIAQPGQLCNELQGIALWTVAVVAESEFKEVLNAYFYRIMIAKAGLRAKMSAEMFLRRYAFVSLLGRKV